MDLVMGIPSTRENGVLRHPGGPRPAASARPMPDPIWMQQLSIDEAPLLSRIPAMRESQSTQSVTICEISIAN